MFHLIHLPFLFQVVLEAHHCSDCLPRTDPSLLMMTKFLSEVESYFGCWTPLKILLFFVENPYSWHTKYNLIFIDNPVGTGFSFTDADGYCQNITQVAKQLYSGLSQFFHLFPWLASNPFYITGLVYTSK